MYYFTSNEWYIKYFENRGKNMLLLIKDGGVLNKYNEAWNNIKETLNIIFIAYLFMMKNT